MLETITLAFKAIIEIPKILNRMETTIGQVQDSRIDRELIEVKEQLNILTNRLKDAPTREEMLNIVAAINNS